VGSTGCKSSMEGDPLIIREGGGEGGRWKGGGKSFKTVLKEGICPQRLKTHPGRGIRGNSAIDMGMPIQRPHSPIMTPA